MEFLIIENNPDRAEQFDAMGIDRIFIDLEIMGKIERQANLDTVISISHKITDIDQVKARLKKSKLLVRCNPIHADSQQEIDEIIVRGADIVMLPFFKSALEVEKFIEIVAGRATTTLLLETPQAFCRIDNILSVKGIDEIHIGLNDLHLGMGLSFMFELISTGIVDILVSKIKQKGIKFGIGGIANLSGGLVTGGSVLAEHVRLGSSMVILSRAMTSSFKDDMKGIEQEVLALRSQEFFLKEQPQSYFEDSHKDFVANVDAIAIKKITVN